MRALKSFSELTEREQAHKNTGVMIGIVADNKDPDGLYRVKVKLPTLQDGKDGTEYVTDWCRICTPMAGLSDPKGENPKKYKRGLYFLPEIGDEVLICFQEGDVASCFVIGALWNQKDKPPVDINEDKENAKRGVYTRDGHKIEFVDKADEGIITIESEKHGTIVINDKDQKITIIGHNKNNNIEIDSAANKILVNCDGDIEMTAKNNIKLTADGTIETTSKGDTKMTSSAQFTVKSSSNMTLNSSASANFEASGTCTIKGATVNIN